MASHLPQSLEREFLMLGRDWLLARLYLMGGRVGHRKWASYDLIGWQIDESGTHAEMHLVIQEMKHETVRQQA